MLGFSCKKKHLRPVSPGVYMGEPPGPNFCFTFSL
jgi:hypothetical protein